MTTHFRITHHNIDQAVQALGMNAMSYGQLGMVMRKHKPHSKTSFASACIVQAAKAMRFKRRLGF